jgi:hypothetical protein
MNNQEEETKKPKAPPKIYELVGRVNHKDRKRAYKGKNAGDFYYQLHVIIENQEGVNKIFVFPDKLENEKV